MPVAQQVVQGEVVHPPPGQIIQGTVVHAQPVIVGAWDPGPQHYDSRPRQQQMGIGMPFQHTMMAGHVGALPPRVPPGCVPVQEPYCGPVTAAMGLLICFCFGCGCIVVCCPCDERTIYVAPDGSRYFSDGSRCYGL
mmetsp:Transcript_48537/g.89400  ORF Transcript_48537/g.89400 Transcript_48537/m.89400 type:complete len:137 (-) Transcript_48537:66-476(-)